MGVIRSSVLGQMNLVVLEEVLPASKTGLHFALSRTWLFHCSMSVPQGNLLVQCFSLGVDIVLTKSLSVELSLSEKLRNPEEKHRLLGQFLRLCLPNT